MSPNNLQIHVSFYHMASDNMSDNNVVGSEDERDEDYEDDGKAKSDAFHMTRH